MVQLEETERYLCNINSETVQNSTILNSLQYHPYSAMITCVRSRLICRKQKILTQEQKFKKRTVKNSGMFSNGQLRQHRHVDIFLRQNK